MTLTVDSPTQNPLGPTEQSMKVFLDRYALRNIDTGEPLERTYDQMWERVGRAVAANSEQADRFTALMDDFKFIPGGRILYAAGQGTRATLGNCYVLEVDDTRESIFGTLGDAMNILAKGGGVGYNFSNLRPNGTPLRQTGGHASGPCSFISVYNAAARTIEQGGSRRAAQMGQLNITHPEILDFIRYKRDHNKDNKNGETREWNHFNVSVAINTAPEVFWNAVRNDESWPLTWGGKEYTRVPARELWNEIIHSAWESGDPGLFFLQRAQEWSNTKYCERIIATNPCGEIPLPDGGVCFLGSMNIVKYVKYWAGLNQYLFDWTSFGRDVQTAVDFLDRCVTVNHFPIDRTKTGLKTRRIGLGLMGLADAAILMGIPYDSEDMVNFTREVYKFMMEMSYQMSINLASRFGAFPAYDRRFLDSPFINRLPPDLRRSIQTWGIRNGHLMTQAPTGTISILAGVSSGLEPNFADVWLRRDRTGSHIVEHPLRGHTAMRKANDIAPIWHLKVQNAAQEYIDQSVSKTINMPNWATPEDVEAVYRYAFEHALKGVTVFRDGCFDGVLYHIELCPMCEEAGTKVVLSRQDGCTVCPNCDYKGSCSI